MGWTADGSLFDSRVGQVLFFAFPGNLQQELWSPTSLLLSGYRVRISRKQGDTIEKLNTAIYRDADMSLARPGRKQATAAEDFHVHISYLLS